MEHWKTIAIAVAVTVVLFVPFYPFRIIKRVVFALINKYIPFPFKFSDIGGFPLLGMRMFRVRIMMGGGNAFEAAELRIGIKPWRLLMRQPVLDPLMLCEPRIVTIQEKSKQVLWFLLPVFAVWRILGMIFSNIMGPSIVTIQNGNIIVRGKKGDTVIDGLTGRFVFRGAAAEVEYMTCRIGNGTIELKRRPGRGEQLTDVRVRDLDIAHLKALKVPSTLTGKMDVEGVLRGNLAESELDAQATSPCLYMRDEPILDFTSPLVSRGTVMTFTDMRGTIGDMEARGSLSADFETDMTHLKLEGGGKGFGAGSVFKMLKMRPYIDTCELDAYVDIEGDFDRFQTMSGDINVKFKDAVINPEAFNAKRVPGKTLVIPRAEINFFLSDSALFSQSSTAEWFNVKIEANGHIDMKYDVESERVYDSTFDVHFRTEHLADMPHGGDFSLPSIQQGHVRIDVSSKQEGDASKGGGIVELHGVHMRPPLLESNHTLRDLLSMEFERVATRITYGDGKVYFHAAQLLSRMFALDLEGSIGAGGALEMDGRLLRKDEISAEGTAFSKLSSMLLRNRHLHLLLSGTTKHPALKLRMVENGEHKKYVAGNGK